MNNKHRELSYRATQYCCDVGKNEAWLWEDKYAELLIQACIQKCAEVSPQAAQAIADEFEISLVTKR